MYIVNKDGTQNEIVKAYDEVSQEYGYLILCDCCDEPVGFLPECIFLDLMEDGQFKVFVDDEDDSDEMCDCPYCQGFRDGIESAMDTIEALDDMCDCECGECCEVCEPDEFEGECTCEVCEYDSIRADIIGELKLLKRAFQFYASEQRWKEYDEIFELYSKMYNLAFNE